MNLRLESKNVLVTGGSSGIGLAVVKAMLNAGANVTVIDRLAFPQEEKLSRQVSSRFRFEIGDIRSPEEFTKSIPSGGIDILVLSAALGPFDTDSLAILSTNYHAAVQNILLSAPQFNSWASIVLISSTAAYRMHWTNEEWQGILDEPFEKSARSEIWKKVEHLPPEAAYALSKWGILNATHRLSKQFASKKIRINCVIPGPTKTEMSRILWEGKPEKWHQLINESPFDDCNTPDEVASLILYLGSSLARMIDASFIHMDGGLHAVLEPSPKL